MARLIDPKTFRMELDKLDCIDKFGYVILPITKLNIALERSTVDAVPVCRCENCVYWDAGTRKYHKDGDSEWDEAICDYFHEIGISQTVYTNANWFCADGERKGGDE